jgi:dephospho-CoA kinase
MILVGLTGSIGMGKTATADIFRSEGAPVYDSDRLVHKIYAGAAAQEIEKAFPGSTRDGAVDRNLLSRMVLNDPEAMKRLEAIVHPLVWEGRRKFLEEQERLGRDIAVLDIPLLFETGSEKDVDKIVVVTAPKSLQRERVLARPNMTGEKFEAILARQTPDEEKRRRADFIIHTDKGFDAAREEVRAILRALRCEKEGNC